MKPLSPRIRRVLDVEQAAAVEAFGLNTLVLAPAGSGKTRVLTYGLAHLIEDCGMQPAELLLLTFTRKAAQVMRERAAQVSEQNLEGLFCGTFHALGVRLLLAAGRDFAVIDETEAVAVIAQLTVEALGERETEEVELLPVRLNSLFSQVREEDVELEALLEAAPEMYRQWSGLIVEVGERYRQHKTEGGFLDYADILWELREALRDGTVLPGPLRAVLVDEAQDLNKIQRDIVRLLTADGAWQIEVGDAQQSIYGFRGASHAALLAAGENPGITVRKLRSNYRSVAEIVVLSAELLPQAAGAPPVRAVRPPSGEPPLLLRPSSVEAEATAVLGWAQERLQRGVLAEDLCVLARAHEHLRHVEETFQRAGCPVARLGRRGKMFDDCRRTLLSFMRLADAPQDVRAWQPLLPLLGYAEDGLPLRAEALAGSGSLTAAAAALVDYQPVRQLLGMLDGETSSSWLWGRVCLGPFADMLAAGLPDPLQVPRLLRELFDAGQFEGEGEEYLRALALNAGEDTPGPGVRLGTVHAAKGLEWPHVLVARCSYGAFPSRSAVSADEQAEEQRLFYVAVTRAQDSLTVCEAPWLSGGQHERDFLTDPLLRACFRSAG